MLRERSQVPELMDEESGDFEGFRRTLADLERINRLTFAYRPTVAWLERLLGRVARAEPVTILDVGCGHGDMLRRLRSSLGRPCLELTGLDRHPWCIQAARLADPASSSIRYLEADVLAHNPRTPYDIVISSLFTHHLTDEELACFIAWMEENSRLGWHVNDLHRHRLPWTAAKVLCPLLRMHPTVRHDAPVSVARAFRRRDWKLQIERAGLPGDAAEVRWHMPFRLCVGRVK